MSVNLSKYVRGREPIYYHGSHKLWIIAGGPQITTLYPKIIRLSYYDGWRLLIASYLKYLLIMELRLDVILYSKLGNENSDAGHIKCSRGPHLARGRQVSTPEIYPDCVYSAALCICLSKHLT